MEQGGLFEELGGPAAESGQGRPRVRLAVLEQWLAQDAPAPNWWDGYLFLRARGVRYRDAMLAVWLSLSSDDRGDVATREDFANLMGVARATTYGWEGKRPEIRQWAEVLQVMRLRGSRLAEVDERTFQAAVGGDSSPTDRKLYYQRAGVWENDVDLGDERATPVLIQTIQVVAPGGDDDAIDGDHSEG